MRPLCENERYAVLHLLNFSTAGDDYRHHYIQDRHLKPDLVVDITPFWEKKISAIRAFRTQFYDPKSAEPETYISNPAFLKFEIGRAHV
jgi:LmbE family N-acetylglucosaminyl deacetylase